MTAFKFVSTFIIWRRKHFDKKPMQIFTASRFTAPCLAVNTRAKKSAAMLQGSQAQSPRISSAHIAAGHPAVKRLGAPAYLHQYTVNWPLPLPSLAQTTEGRIVNHDSSDRCQASHAEMVRNPIPVGVSGFYSFILRLHPLFCLKWDRNFKELPFDS